MKRNLLIAAAVVLVGVAATVPVAGAQEPADPTREVLAIPSPMVAPVCAASGLSTLLVPILGGLVEEQLSLGETVNVGDVLLDALGPAFLVCGQLPAPDGTRCALIDDQIVAVYPGDLAEVFPAPPAAGGIIEGVANASALLGLDSQDLLEEPLRCSVPAAPGAPEAPPIPPAALGPVVDPPLSPAIAAQTPTGGIRPPTVGAPATTSGAAVVTSSPTPGTSSRTVLQIAFRHVSDLVSFLQLLVAALLAIFLVCSWTSSARIRRGAP